MSVRKLPGIVLLAMLCATAASAEMTGWMTEKQLNRYVERKMNGGRAYPVDIQCGVSKGKSYIRLDTVPFNGKPPFFRWQWVIAEKNNLQQAIANISLKKRPDLKYSIVKSMEFDLNGTPTTCAVLYR